MISGCALLIDYVLTITISIASAPMPCSASCERLLSYKLSVRSRACWFSHY